MSLLSRLADFCSVGGWGGVGLHVGLLQICSDIRKIFARDPIQGNKYRYLNCNNSRCDPSISNRSMRIYPSNTISTSEMFISIYFCGEWRVQIGLVISIYLGLD